MKVVPNQVMEYCEQIRSDLTKMHNDLIEAGYPQEKCNKVLDMIEEKIKKVKEYMNGTIDIGGIVAYNVKPKDIVKIEYNDGTICYCFEVKEGRKKSKYYYCGSYVY